MFVDFDKVLKKAKEPETKLPDALVDYLSKSLPKGFEYKQLDDGICTVVPKDNNLQIGGWKILLTEHQKKILGDSFTQKDLWNYLENAQIPFEIIPADGTNITLNGEKFPIDDMIISPKNPKKKLEMKRYILPHKFSIPQPIPISCGNICKNIAIQRIANDSVDEIIFESLSEESIYLKILLNQKKHCSTINMSLKDANIKTVTELIEAMTLFNAFVNGELCMFEQRLQHRPTEKKSTFYDEETISFWKKVLEIETYLNLKFTPPKEDIDDRTACEIEKLYQCLINKVPIKDNYTVDSVSGDWNLKDDIDNSLNKPIFLTFKGYEEFEIFEERFTLPCRIALFNSVFKEIQNFNDERKIIIDDESDDKKRFTSVLLFKTDEETSKFKIQEHIDEFKNAKSPMEYI